MKTKKFNLILMLFTTILISLALTSCGLFRKICFHKYEDVVINPTCHSVGYTVHTCLICKNSYTDTTVAEIEHDYVETIDPPSCESQGVKHYTCKECDYSYSQPIETTEHNYSSNVTLPTCTVNGYTTYVCIDCNDTYIDSIVPAKGHNYISEIIAPNCTAPGITVYTCTQCPDSYTDSTTEPMGHNYVSKITPPTCKESGMTTYICSRCKDSYTDSPTDPKGHNYVATNIDATCEAEGYTRHTCSDCGDFYDDQYVSKTAHRFNAGVCVYCQIEASIEVVASDTAWYNEQNMIFTLTTPEQLAGFSELVNSGVDFANKTIYLGANIDLSYNEWIPIGNEDNPFVGTFNGNGYTISSLMISTSSSYVGLFGKITGKISDVNIDNATVYVGDVNQYVSILCGYSTSDIKNVQVEGYLDAPYSNYVGSVVGYTTAQISGVTSVVEVVGSNYVGGIAGYISCVTAIYDNLINYGNVVGGEYTSGIIGNLTATGVIYVKLVENYGDISGAAYTGGLFGYVCGSLNSIITNSTSSSAVNGAYYVGAIAGAAENVVISECSNVGSSVSATSCIIEGNNYFAYLGAYVGKGYIVKKCSNSTDINYISRGSYVGGIAGYLTNSINDCSNNGSIYGYDCVGGLAGYISSNTSVTLSYLVNSGDVYGNFYVGGIVGHWTYENTFVVSGCENSGSVIGNAYIGGIAGSLNQISNSLLTVSGVVNYGDITAADGWAGGLFGYVDGNTSSVVNECTSTANIIGSYYIGGLIGQAVNLTLKDSSNEGSTITANGFIVEGEESNVYAGGYIGSGSSVCNCTNNSDIIYNSLGSRIGGIIGYATGSISDCTNNGNITSLGGVVGGVVGEIASPRNQKYNNLKNTGSLKGLNSVGGVVGRFYWSGTNANFSHEWVKGNGGDKSHCYDSNNVFSEVCNYGTVEGVECIGGLIGSVDINTSHLSYIHCSSKGWHCEFFYYARISMENISNYGDITGDSSAGELIGLSKIYKAESWYPNCTVTNYTLLGSVTQNGEISTDYKPIGQSTHLDISNQIIPETEDNTDNSDEITDIGI